MEERLAARASGQGLPGAVTFHTDATIYRAGLDAGRTFEYSTDDTRRIFVYVTAGDLRVNDEALSAGDQARIDLESGLTLKAGDTTRFVLIDVSSGKGWGYDQNTLRGARANA